MTRLFVLLLFVPTLAGAAGFIQGADVSHLPRIEAGGAVFSAGGVPGDPIAILRAHGVNTIRLRLWHTPAAGRSGLAEVLDLAERARDAGCDLLLDLHYSDTWADPGHQTKPAAWTGLPFTVLADSVRAYTRDVLTACASRGVAPSMVQLGNEISPGMLWDDGRVGGAWDTPAQWANLAALLQAAIAGVDEALSGADRPEIMIHIDRGGDNGGARWFYDHLIAEGVAFDVIGLSYYPWWHGSFAALDANLDDLATRYGKDLVVVETAYPWTLGWFDDTHNMVGLPEHLLPGYPDTPGGQQAFLASLLHIVQTVPDDRGRGVCWWEPCWIPSPDFGSPWENVALFDETGEALPALQEFMGTTGTGSAPLRSGLRIAPNPFNPVTTIRFTTATTGAVRLTVTDLAGRLVTTLVEGILDGGNHEVVWRGRDMAGNPSPSGVYLNHLEAIDGVSVEPMILLR